MYPEFETLIQNPNTNRLLEVRRSPISMLSLIAFFIISVVGVYFAIHYIHESFIFALLPDSVVSPRLLTAIPLLLLLEILRRLHNDLYILSQHRITHLHGRFSLSYNVPVIKYVDIRAINVIQDFWGRIFDYGDVAVGTAAHEGNEILIHGVKSPDKLALLLDQLRSHSIAIENADAKKS